RPALVAALALHAAAPLLYIVQNDDLAQRAAADLCAWLGEDAVLHFPASDAMPYEHMSPGPTVIAARLRVLAALANREPRTAEPQNRRIQNNEPRRDSSRFSVLGSLQVVVTSIKALIQPTLSPSQWAEASTALASGQEHSPDDLMRRWVTLGYRNAPTVEEPGEINRRGGIIDLWPPGDDLPLRIEFFGDEIDSLRRFDPISQRSERREQALQVGPPHEFPLWQAAQAAERLRALPVDTLRLEVREEWNTAIERIEQGERFEGRALYAPFYREQGQIPALLEHLPATSAAVFSDLVLLAHHAEDITRQSEERRAAHIEAGELPRAFPRPYLAWNELLAQGYHLNYVDLSNNDLPETSHEQPDAQDPLAPRFSTSETQLFPAPPFENATLFSGQLKLLVEDIVERLGRGERVLAVTPQAARIQELVEEAARTKNEEQSIENGDGIEVFGSQFSVLFSVVHGSLDQGFRATAQNLTIYTDSEIFGWRQRRVAGERRSKRDRDTEARTAFLRGLKAGDYVVHIEHGIAQYDGLIRRAVGGIERDYLNLRYADGDKLYVPVDQIDRVSRYIGSGDATPQLTRLGTQDWERAKRKARAAVQDLADDLLELYAARQTSEGHAFAPDNEWQRELEESFPYIETPDQARAIEATKHDMEQQQPMDRLVIGDVGFGKTEVALRAAFKAVQDGKQVAVLVPTTVLAQQHLETLTRRMAAFPIKIEMLSRLRTAQQQSQILDQLLRGEIDILVGTHRILSKDVVFKDLGMLVVDEEQRFGVRHKERIKQLRANIDVLTLTATPIPRTLHMAMAGIRDMSVIDTPPEDRLPIKTYVLPHDDKLIQEAIRRELERGGQVFFIHNRVQSIYYIADKLKKLVPEARYLVGHGQLDEKQLEKVMLNFFSGKADVLVSTTIVESGLDVPNANTIIIDDAIHYGLAQLYQLRGRVGRSTQRAYAYLFYPSDRRITDEAHERLQAIQEATELGAGMRIAMRDLEIRGAGNLLGAEQSGHIGAVGFDLYTRLLEQAVSTLKKQFHAGKTKDEGPEGTNHDPRATNQNPIARRFSAGNANTGNADAGNPSPQSPARARIKVDEKVLVGPLVTLDLPLDAYIPVDYIPDDRVRLEVYQRLAESQTPQRVRELQTELRDRFGEIPDPVECLLTWLMLKALSLRAGVGSIVTTDEEFIIRLPEGGLADRERLRLRFRHDGAIKIGPQFARLDRRTVRDEWVPALSGILETLARHREDAGRG
ncbi:MAG: transcription-repair coupling factor, partial [Roseiflexaceae bacterium]|nr:transcription-repair coupling factor [Roseiflexaceae bacterium]